MATPTSVIPPPYFVSGPSEALRVYSGQTSLPSAQQQMAGQPRPKYTWFIQFFKSNPTSNNVILQAKSVEKPKFKFATETLNEYNKKRVVQTKIEYEPIMIRFYDTVDNTVMLLFREYAQWNIAEFNGYTSQDWIFDQTSATFNNAANGWGRILNNKSGGQGSNFFNTLEIYEIYGNKYYTITAVNPKIVGFDFDNLDYSNSADPQEITMTIAHEGIYWSPEQSVQPMLDNFIYQENLVDLQNNFNPANATMVPQNRTATSPSASPLTSANFGTISQDPNQQLVGQSSNTLSLDNLTGILNSGTSPLAGTPPSALSSFGALSFTGAPNNASPPASTLSDADQESMQSNLDDTFSQLGATSPNGVPLYNTNQSVTPPLAYQLNSQLPSTTQAGIPPPPPGPPPSGMPTGTIDWSVSGLTPSQTNALTPQDPASMFSNTNQLPFGTTPDTANANPSIPGGGAFNNTPYSTPVSVAPLDPAPGLANYNVAAAVSPTITGNAQTLDALYTTQTYSTQQQISGQNSSPVSTAPGYYNPGISSAQYDTVIGSIPGGSYTSPFTQSLASALVINSIIGGTSSSSLVQNVLLSNTISNILNSTRPPTSQIGVAYAPVGNTPWMPGSSPQVIYGASPPNTSFNQPITYPLSQTYGYPPQYNPSYPNPQSYNYTNNNVTYPSTSGYGGFNYPYTPQNGSYTYNPQYPSGAQPNYLPQSGYYQPVQPFQTATNIGALVVSELIRNL